MQAYLDIHCSHVAKGHLSPCGKLFFSQQGSPDQDAYKRMLILVFSAFMWHRGVSHLAAHFYQHSKVQISLFRCVGSYWYSLFLCGLPRWLSWLHIELVIRRLQVQPPPGWQHPFMEIHYVIFSTVILSFPLIQEGQLLSVSGERMCTILGYP